MVRDECTQDECNILSRVELPQLSSILGIWLKPSLMKLPMTYYIDKVIIFSVMRGDHSICPTRVNIPHG